jgi:hypothetical protein
MPGDGYAPSAPNYYGGTQYPVTPYPAPGAPAYAAGAPAAASNGYMPPSDPYAAAPANPYAQAQAANPYGAPAAPANSYPPANPYGQPGGQPAPNQDASYTAAGQYGASSYPGAPSGGAESPYYTR